jgi:hypothetical protein
MLLNLALIGQGPALAAAGLARVLAPLPAAPPHTSVATRVNARARTGSPVPIGAKPFRQGREHGHGNFWPLLQYGV